MGKTKIQINQKFNRLTVIKRIDDYITPKGQHFTKYLCKCVCGNYVEVLGKNLRNGNTQSCGCLQKEIRSKKQKKYNTYDLSGEYGIGYTSNTNNPFYFNLEDYEKIKDYCWAEHHDGYIYTTDKNHNYISLHCFLINSNNNNNNSNNNNNNNIKTDHICTERKYDNRKSNLRLATHTDNMCNRKTPTNNTSGTKGVYYDKSSNKWIASITRNHKRISKTFFKKEDAIEYRKFLENKIQGEYSYNNSQKLYKECI